MRKKTKNIDIIGLAIDLEGRCKHYHEKNDTVSIKFKCCNKFYPCYKCHEENVNHHTQLWGKEEFHVKAILCGICKQELTIDFYLHNDRCNNCNAAFNLNCSRHYNKYFNTGEDNISNYCF